MYNSNNSSPYRLVTSQKLQKPIISSNRNPNHLNSIVLPQDKLLNSRYHYRKTIQLQFQNQDNHNTPVNTTNKNFAESRIVMNKGYNELSPDSIIEEIEQGIQKHMIGKPNRAFKASSTKPLISHNVITPSFQENDYPLQPQQRIKVQRQKVFQIKNYYNYLYEMAIEEHTLQLQKQHMAISTLLKPDRKISSGQQKQRRQRQQQQEKKFLEQQSSFYKARTVPKQQEHIMDPVHFSYEDQHRDTFNHKEIDRLRMSQIKSRGPTNGKMINRGYAGDDTSGQYGGMSNGRKYNR